MAGPDGKIPKAPGSPGVEIDSDYARQLGCRPGEEDPPADACRTAIEPDRYTSASLPTPPPTAPFAPPGRFAPAPPTASNAASEAATATGSAVSGKGPLETARFFRELAAETLQETKRPGVNVSALEAQAAVLILDAVVLEQENGGSSARFTGGLRQVAKNRADSILDEARRAQRSGAERLRSSDDGKFSEGLDLIMAASRGYDLARLLFETIDLDLESAIRGSEQVDFLRKAAEKAFSRKKYLQQALDLFDLALQASGGSGDSLEKLRIIRTQTGGTKKLVRFYQKALSSPVPQLLQQRQFSLPGYDNAGPVDMSKAFANLRRFRIAPDSPLPPQALPLASSPQTLEAEAISLTADAVSELPSRLPGYRDLLPERKAEIEGSIYKNLLDGDFRSAYIRDGRITAEGFEQLAARVKGSASVAAPAGPVRPERAEDDRPVRDDRDGREDVERAKGKVFGK
ncbi:MAG: hypothetical protein V2A66_10300 [Pseudomonadota bacterium]